MNKTIWVAAVLSLAAMDTSWAQSHSQAIPADWKPAGLRPLAVTTVRASSTFAGMNGPYAPSQLVDGNRGTKWVGDVAASPQAPQWVELDLHSPQTVNALALFGAEIGKDGFRAGAIQVANGTGDALRTVAALDKAPAERWLATFAPVKASKIRLLITQSGGQSSHTDVFEIQLFGPPLSEAELKQQLVTELASLGQSVEQMRTAADKLSTPLGPRWTAPAQHVARMARQSADLTGQFQRWDALSAAERTELAQQAEQIGLEVRQWIACLGRLPGVWADRLAELRAVQKLSPKGPQATSRREGSRVQLGNGRVVVSLDEASGTWDATWMGDVEAALRRVRFSVEADGRQFSPEKVAAEVVPIRDRLGVGMQIRQSWGDGVRIERFLQIYDDKPAIVLSGRIENRSGRDVPLAAIHAIDLSAQNQGWWLAGQTIQTPGVVTAEGLAQLGCEPERAPQSPGGVERVYQGTGLLALGYQEPASSLLAGYLTAQEAQPDLAARFRPVEGGLALQATQRLLGRILPAGATLEMDRVYLAAQSDPYRALEHYGDAVAAMSRLPVRKGPTSLWCSWYAHRMAMGEDVVLANAAVAARHLAPLGLKIMQLDHGWQRGDVTGDWFANERFPHGLKWLAEQLQSRYGLKLGLWIAPTDVAETSELFQKHPDWMLRTADGKPASNWRWYWKPNPMCYELDASHPGADKWIADTFARLSSEGSSYYKIDFIAAAAGEHFRRHDPQTTPGWGVLKRAMDALRRGAGDSAWIRYTQTPYLLTVGLGDSGIAGCDTLDAGLGGQIEVLRTNARSLAASYWINDRLYHRELCDLSVRMHAELEEVRLRLAMMGLAGCSVSFSDELQYLPDSRLRMMQQTMPPGGPPMRPLDLYERYIPSIWHIACKTAFDTWDVVGLFNFENQPETRTVSFGRVGLPAKTDVIAFEFWEQKLLGIHQDQLTLTLPPQSSRILMLRRAADRPQVIGTDMHLLGGVHELSRLEWDGTNHVLSGQCRRVPGLTGRIYLHVPAGYRPHFDFPLIAKSAQVTNLGNGLWMKEFRFEQPELSWTIPFDGPADKKDVRPAREPNLTN